MFVNQLMGVGDGGFRLVGIVEALQLQLPVVNAVSRIGLVESRFDSETHVPSQFSGGSAEGGGLSEKDVTLGYANLLGEAPRLPKEQGA